MEARGLLRRTVAMCLVMLLFASLSHGSQPQSPEVVLADKILKEIEAGLPVVYNNVVIVGDLDVNRLELPTVHVKRTILEINYLGLSEDSRVIASPITIVNSFIRGSIDFKGTTLQKKIDFSNTEFLDHVYFQGAQIHQSAAFLNSRFNQSVSFAGSRFNQSVAFWGSQFNHSASFKESRFNQSVDFLNSRFNQSDFSGSWFNQSAAFLWSRFNQSANFAHSRFNRDANFFDSRFNQFADFSSSSFNQSAKFSHSEFIQSAIFRDSRFNESVDFSDSRFHQSADFSSTRFNQEAYFQDADFLDANFDNSQFSKEAFFDYSKINGTLSFYRTKHDKLNIRWSNIHDLAYDDTAYYLLIDNFKKQGFTDDANDCYYSYRCKHGWELLRQGKYLNWLFDSLAWWGYGYGLRPGRPLGWSAFFIIAAGMFFWRSKSIKRKEDDPKEVSIWEAFLLSATYYTSGASAIISGTSDEFKPLGKSRYVIVFLRLMGWVFFVLFLSSLSKIA